MANSFSKINYCFLLVLLMSSFQLMAQTTTVQLSGTVISDDRQPLVGVNITVKGQNISTVSDQKGAWKLVAPGTNVSLVFSFVGYNSVEEEVKGRRVINITLTPEVKSMEDVVVIGYAAVKRKDLTGAVSSVSAQQLKDIPLNSAAEALAGRLAGVQIVSSEGKPGADYTITVRGGSSITQDNSPLYVVDGIQVENALNNLAPQDIESIDVLKDAAATAIYGARGANGVVIITTKKGREGRTTVNYNAFWGIRSVAKKLDVMSPYDFILYQYERTRRTTQDSSNFANLYGNDLNVYKTIKNVDWQEEMFGRNAPMQTHNISVGGGSKGTTFNLSFTYNKEDGVMLNSGLDRKLINFKLDHKASDKFRVGFNVRYNNQEVTGAGTADEGSSGYNMLRHSVKYRPFIIGAVEDPAQYDPDYFDASNAGNGLGIINPIQLSNAQYRKIFTKVFNFSGFANYSFNKFLSFRGTVGVDYNITDRHNFDDTLTSNSRGNGASLPLIALYNGLRTTIDNSNVFTFTNASVRKKHSIDIILGNEIYNVIIKNTDNQLRYFPQGITAEKAIGQQSLGTAVPLFPRNNNAESRQVSFFGRANYGYQDKYLLSLSFRADGSSKFAIDNHWGYFPSASVAWRISQEPFMANLKGKADLKLRASYGESGNNRIGDYLYSTSYATTSQYALNGVVQNGYASTYLANKILKWETNVSRNLGIDAAFLKSRIQVSLDVYKNTGDDLLINAPIATTTGFATQLQNIGSTSNKGVELQLQVTPIQHANFTWNVNFNIGHNDNRIVRLASTQKSYLQNSGFGISGQPADFIVKIGESVGSMYGYVYDGFYTVNDFDYDAGSSRYTLKKGVTDVSKTLGVAQPGWMKLKDFNGDQIIDEDDKTIIGNANPKFSGGLNQQFRYKTFDLSVFVNFVYGNTVYNANKIEFSNGYGLNTNLLGEMANRWKTIDETGKLVQQVSTVGGVQIVTGIAPELLAALNRNATVFQPISGAGAFFPTSYVMEDGSYLRFNNVTLGYTLPNALLHRMKINSLRIYATVNNLAIITGYSGYDPDVNTRRSTPLTPNVDYSAYPRSRAYIFGINLSL